MCTTGSSEFPFCSPLGEGSVSIGASWQGRGCSQAKGWGKDGRGRGAQGLNQGGDGPVVSSSRFLKGNESQLCSQSQNGPTFDRVVTATRPEEG